MDSCEDRLLKQTILNKSTTNIVGQTSTSNIHCKSRITHSLARLINTFIVTFPAFPPLSLSALKEYQPTITGKPSLTTIHSKQQPPTQANYTTEFIWEQSILSSENK
jgi:hypothetical protein